MFSYQPSFVLGFHGCDKEIGETVFSSNEDLIISENSYDWLGHGIYFWEQNPYRALEYAEELKKRSRKGHKRIDIPFVVGTVIDLGRCLNLFESESLKEVRKAYEILASSKKKLPVNQSVIGTGDLLLRRLDCAVVETVHSIRKDLEAAQYDTVRGAFIEGKPLYPTAGFNEKNHIQICVRDPGCIKGYFRPKMDLSAE